MPKSPWEPSAADVLDATALQIRNTYIQEYRRHQEQLTGQPSRYNSTRQWDGLPSRRGRTAPPVWPRIARRVLELHLDPESFVSCQFDECERAPLPTELLKDAAVRRYMAHRETSREMIRLMCDAQSSAAAIEVGALMEVTGDSEAECWCQVLLNRSLQLSALYRYCAAVRLLAQTGDARFAKLRDIFHAAATLQYLRYREAYDEFWVEILPVEFARDARRESLATDWSESEDDT